jgi:hypothetical protein
MGEVRVRVKILYYPSLNLSRKGREDYFDLTPLMFPLSVDGEGVRGRGEKCAKFPS